MVAVGRAEFSVSVYVALHPLALVTFTEGVYWPFAEYRKDGFCRDDVSLGLPVKFHNQVTAADVVSVKFTSMGDWQAMPLFTKNGLGTGPAETGIVLVNVDGQLPIFW